MYAVFVGSANGLRRFRTQASFDVGFSTTKTVLLLGFALLWKVIGAFIGFAAAAAVILVVAVARDAAAGRRRTVPDPAHRALHVGGARVHDPAQSLAQLGSAAAAPLRAVGAGRRRDAAAAVAGNYEALRTFALLPYQALLVVTFVIFPLVSRSTFAADREATRAYVTQTMRYALILAGVMGIVLAARPAALFGVIYKPELRRRRGGAADPRGRAVLPGAAVRGLLDPERGRPDARDADADGGDAGDRRGGHRAVVPHAAPGTPMLIAAASATAVATATGLVAALVVLRARFGGGPPVATVVRVGARDGGRRRRGAAGARPRQDRRPRRDGAGRDRLRRGPGRRRASSAPKTAPSSRRSSGVSARATGAVCDSVFR